MNIQHSFNSFTVLITTFVAFCVLKNAASQQVNYEYCAKYEAEKDNPNAIWNTYPLIYMGQDYDKRFYITTRVWAGSYFNANFNYCGRFGLKPARITTQCQYGIIEKWFLANPKTTDYAWISGFRFGNYRFPIWMETGEPIGFDQFGLSATSIPGPYAPGGYSPISYPWVDCLSVSRNCPTYTSAPTNPCNRTDTYPGLQFMWNDCRLTNFRVICEKSIYG